jgi:glycine dehydrogenase
MTDFAHRHIGSTDGQIQEMLGTLGLASLDALVQATVPQDIQLSQPLNLSMAQSEEEMLAELRRLGRSNQLFRSFIGMGYYDCLTPPVIARNILENPAWYTQYTPYQAEIAQGRLEALLNFQTMVADLTGLPLANASLLDEATAAAEAMSMCRVLSKVQGHTFFVAEDCHPQTLAVLRTRAQPLNITLQVGNPDTLEFIADQIFGLLLSYPSTDGALRSYEELVRKAHEDGALVVASTDLLALTLLVPPGEWGADIAVGSSQRFGVPMGYGGPHAAFLATKEEFKRQIPGRVVGVSKDTNGRKAYRLALQTREQHIRRDRATSNICTAQVLLANMASMYAVYHGPEGLKAIASRIHHLTNVTAEGLRRLECKILVSASFDTLRVQCPSLSAEEVEQKTKKASINFRRFEDDTFGISLDETTTMQEISQILTVFSDSDSLPFSLDQLGQESSNAIPAELQRHSPYLTHRVFHEYHSEHELLRYMYRLQSKDLSLVHSMIPLGSCTMKLNATAEMIPITWPEFSRLHPFVPAEQAKGYHLLTQQLEAWLAEITGFAAVSLQPNAGSQGEYAGLMVIRAYQDQRGEDQRNVCLIPVSAHGTNPASAVIAGMQVVPVACDSDGNIDLQDLEAKCKKYHDTLAALMVTYPSTHGVFEETIRQVCTTVHHHGGQVYMDGANMNAMVGIVQPGDIGADVCHLNLHKTFCIPHGGGGPGMGPIAVASHLVPFLPNHPLVSTGGSQGIGAIAAAPYGSPNILPISWAFIQLMGGDGLTKATQVAILNANYMTKRLRKYYSVLFTGKNGMVAHEFILDLRPFKKSADVDVEDVAKRLMDYGFHAPTISWPVPGTMMVEPTESESKAELDRYCEALISIRKEIAEVYLAIIILSNMLHTPWTPSPKQNGHTLTPENKRHFLHPGYGTTNSGRPFHELIVFMEIAIWSVPVLRWTPIRPRTPKALASKIE